MPELRAGDGESVIFRLNYSEYEVPDDMDREQIIGEIMRLPGDLGQEEAHEVADKLLLLLVDDERVTNAFMDLDKWYA